MSNNNFHIITPRLVITHFDPSKESHIAFTLELYKDYTTIDKDGNVVREVPNRAAAIAMMETRVAQVKSTGFGRYLVSALPPSADSQETVSERIERATPVGIVTINVRGPNTPPLPDVGFNLLPSTRGKGYATEALEGLTRWYEKEKGMTELLAYVEDDNEPSMRVLKRAGFELLGERHVKSLANSGGLNRSSPKRLLVWTRGLTKDPTHYGL